LCNVLIFLNLFKINNSIHIYLCLLFNIYTIYYYDDYIIISSKLSNVYKTLTGYKLYTYSNIEKFSTELLNYF